MILNLKNSMIMIIKQIINQIIHDMLKLYEKGKFKTVCFIIWALNEILVNKMHLRKTS